jgi:hypothetical protein
VSALQGHDSQAGGRDKMRRTSSEDTSSQGVVAKRSRLPLYLAGGHVFTSLAVFGTVWYWVVLGGPDRTYLPVSLLPAPLIWLQLAYYWLNFPVIALIEKSRLFKGTVSQFMGFLPVLIIGAGYWYALGLAARKVVELSKRRRE